MATNITSSYKNGFYQSLQNLIWIKQEPNYPLVSSAEVGANVIAQKRRDKK